MAKKITYKWICRRCGEGGETVMDDDWCAWGQYSILVQAHSAQCPGCDGDAPGCLIFRTAAHSDEDWERLKAVHQRRAETRKRFEMRSPYIILPGDPCQ